MAKNDRLFKGNSIPLTVAAGTKSGDPVVVAGTGPLYFRGRAVIDADPTTNVATVETEGVWNFSVKGVTNGAANSAVVQGDTIYYNAGHTPKLDKDTTGVAFGIAWEPVAAGATTTIGVKVGTV